MKIRTIPSLAVAAAAFTALPAMVTHAEEESADSFVLEEIIVTARKRDELLQEVPIAISVLGAETIEQFGISDVESVARLTSGLTYDQGVLPIDTRPVIRGVTSLRGRPNVGILVDFVDVSSEALTVAGGGITTNLRLLDLERVEVIKGPQNALYGRSAFTGALHYVTRRPGDTFSGDVTVRYDEFETTDLRLSIGGPIAADRLNARLIVSQYDTPGYYVNPNTGGELGASEVTGAALGLEWTLSERTTAYFRVEHSDEYHSQRPEVHISTMDPASDPANFLGTGTVTDAAIMVPHDGFGTTVCNTVDRIQPYYDSFGVPGAPACRPVISGKLHATADMIDLSPDPRTGLDFRGTDVDSTRYHLDFNVELSNLDVTYVFGHLDNGTYFEEDFDKNNRDIVSAFIPFPPPGSAVSQYGLSAMAEQHLDIKQFNHELRLSGESERVYWKLSLLHWEEEMDLMFDDEWYLREGGNAGAVLDVLNSTVFSYLNEPIAPPFVNNMCDAVYPGVAECVPAVTSLQDSLGSNPGIPIWRETTHTSIAGAAIVSLNDSVSVTLEGRYLDEEIRYAGEATDISLSTQFGEDPWWGFMFRTGEITENVVKADKFVPKVTVDWAINDNLVAYGYFAKAFKPGGVSTTDANGDVRDGEYDSEKLDVYELGLKTTLRDRSIRWNSAVFFYDYTDQQVSYEFISSTTGRLQTTIINAGKTEIKGFETDLVWKSAFVDGLRVALGYTFTDAEFTDFNLSEILATVGGEPSAFNRAKAGNFEADLTGKTPPMTSEHAATMSFRYDLSFDNEMASYFELFGAYQSKRFLGEGNRTWIPDYTIWDFYAGLSRDDWSVTLFVENLADDDTIRSGLENIDFTLLPDGRSLPQAVQLYLPQPRTAGLRVQMNFGD
jgi:outer membrane receptor protein involved in Fe transport